MLIIYIPGEKKLSFGSVLQTTLKADKDFVQEEKGRKLFEQKLMQQLRKNNKK